VFQNTFTDLQSWSCFSQVFITFGSCLQFFIAHSWHDRVCSTSVTLRRGLAPTEARPKETVGIYSRSYQSAQARGTSGKACSGVCRGTLERNGQLRYESHSRASIRQHTWRNHDKRRPCGHINSQMTAKTCAQTKTQKDVSRTTYSG
jgi:hypothetical protein